MPTSRWSPARPGLPSPLLPFPEHDALSPGLRRNTFRYVKSLRLDSTPRRSRPVPRAPGRLPLLPFPEPEVKPLSGFWHASRILPPRKETMESRIRFFAARNRLRPTSPGRGNGTRMAEPAPSRDVWPPPAAERQRTHTVSVRFHRGVRRRTPLQLRRAGPRGPRPGAWCRTPSPTRPGADRASAEAVARRVALRRVGRLLNDVTRALHAVHGYPDAETLDALRPGCWAVARQLGRWP